MQNATQLLSIHRENQSVSFAGTNHLFLEAIHLKGGVLASCFAYSGALRPTTSLIFDPSVIGRADMFVDMIEIHLRRMEMPRVCIPYESLDCMYRRKRYTAELPSNLLTKQ
jgi:hypothetical protein